MGSNACTHIRVCSVYTSSLEQTLTKYTALLLTSVNNVCICIWTVRQGRVPANASQGRLASKLITSARLAADPCPPVERSTRQKCAVPKPAPTRQRPTAAPAHLSIATCTAFDEVSAARRGCWRAQLLCPRTARTIRQLGVSPTLEKLRECRAHACTCTSCPVSFAPTSSRLCVTKSFSSPTERSRLAATRAWNCSPRSVTTGTPANSISTVVVCPLYVKLSSATSTRAAFRTGETCKHLSASK